MSRFDIRRVIVVTNHVYPPIPIRSMDWQATLDGYEPGDPLGVGPTEADAVCDLYVQIADREDDDEERARHEQPDPDLLRDQKRDDALWDKQNPLPTDDEPF